jgi:hypothetical protein
MREHPPEVAQRSAALDYPPFKGERRGIGIALGIGIEATGDGAVREQQPPDDEQQNDGKERREDAHPIRQPAARRKEPCRLTGRGRGAKLTHADD